MFLGAAGWACFLFSRALFDGGFKVVPVHLIKNQHLDPCHSWGGVVAEFPFVVCDKVSDVV